jgi:Ca2+-binding RTX toxin-like protein
VTTSYLTTRNDVWWSGEIGTTIVYGLQGNDRIYGDSEVMLIFGGNGNDYLYAGDDSASTVRGGKGKDILINGWESYNSLYGGSDNDVFRVHARGDTWLAGEAGKDRYNLTAYNDGSAHTITVDGYTAGERLYINQDDVNLDLHQFDLTGDGKLTGNELTISVGDDMIVFTHTTGVDLGLF